MNRGSQLREHVKCVDGCAVQNVEEQSLLE